jgi:hypothetical protein
LIRCSRTKFTWDVRDSQGLRALGFGGLLPGEQVFQLIALTWQVRVLDVFAGILTSEPSTTRG